MVLPAPAAVTTPEPAGPGSTIGLRDLQASGEGDNSVSVGATEEMAAAAGNGMNGVISAAQATPVTPSALAMALQA